MTAGIRLGVFIPLEIEREISGPQQIKDIRRARQFLAAILASV